MTRLRHDVVIATVKEAGLISGAKGWIAGSISKQLVKAAKARSGITSDTERNIREFDWFDQLLPCNRVVFLADVRPEQVTGIDVGQGRHCLLGDHFLEDSKLERKKKMARVQMKMVGAVFIVAAMLTTTAVIPRADAQSTSTGQTKRDKQKIIVDDEPESVSKQTNRAKADCEKGHMKWDDTAKKCSK